MLLWSGVERSRRRCCTGCRDIEASRDNDDAPFRILGMSSTTSRRPEIVRPMARPSSRTGLDLDLGGRVGDTSGEAAMTDDLYGYGPVVGLTIGLAYLSGLPSLSGLVLQPE